tara:strand:+ start:69 stop:551 length:483 start_codon:yes stop_codon:yes gene_type:complete
MEKHQINLPDSEIQMLISAYETKLRKIVKPLQRFETGIEICRYLADEKNLKRHNSLWKCEAVNFKNRMDDHNYRVGLGTPDCLTDIPYTRKFRNSSVYREWYLTEIRHSYNMIYARITQLAQFIGYDYSHLVGQLNFSELEQASMDWWLERNARAPISRG